MQKITSHPNIICLYCGNEKQQVFQDYNCYYECNCPDAQKVKEIEEQIRILDSQRPIVKYCIQKVSVVERISWT